MFRQAAIMAGIGGVALLGGCADIMQQQAISQIAPDWFEQKAIEVKGQGYPELADIPQTRAPTSTPAVWDKDSEALKQRAAQLEARLNAQGSIRSDEDVRATAAQWRACVEEEKAVCGSPASPPAIPAKPAPGKSGR
jgi:predicted nucleic acid-binding Zn ribbon protein